METVSRRSCERLSPSRCWVGSLCASDTVFFFFFIGLMALGVLWRSFLPFPKAGATLMVMLEGKI